MSNHQHVYKKSTKLAAYTRAVNIKNYVVSVLLNGPRFSFIDYPTFLPPVSSDSPPFDFTYTRRERDRFFSRLTLKKHLI